MSTVSDLTNQIMIQSNSTLSKASLAFCSPPGYARLSSLADFLFRLATLPRLFAGSITYTTTQTKNYGGLLPYLIRLCYVHTIPDSFCTGTKTILDRSSVHT